MGRKRKKDSPSIELVTSLFIGGLIINSTHNLNKGAIAFFSSLITIFLVSFTIKHIKSQRYKKLLLNSGIDIVDKMTGEEFEKFLMVHFEKLEYKGELTPKTNDYGADLILKKEGYKIVVQAKRWSSKVGIEAVQQILGAKEYYKANECMVVTNNYFTPNALNLASSSRVELWDRKKLLDIMSVSNGREKAQEATNNTDINSRVICPKCGKEMILKKGKYGNFYGCSNYPKCKFTKNIK